MTDLAYISSVAGVESVEDFLKECLNKVRRRVYNTEVPCEVKLKKKDSDGNAIIGVEFELKFLGAIVNDLVKP